MHLPTLHAFSYHTYPRTSSTIAGKANYCHSRSLCCKWTVWKCSPCSSSNALLSYLQGETHASCHSAHTLCPCDKSCCYGNQDNPYTVWYTVLLALRGRRWWCGFLAPVLALSKMLPYRDPPSLRWETSKSTEAQWRTSFLEGSKQHFHVNLVRVLLLVQPPVQYYFVPIMFLSFNFS